MALKVAAGFLLLVAAAAGQTRQQQPSVLNPDGSINFRQQPHGPAPADGFKFLYMVPYAKRQYTGTVEGFATELPGFVQRAAASGLPPRDYGKEISFVIDAFKSCSQLTPQMAASVFEPNGKRYFNKPGGTEALEKLGSQYEICKVVSGPSSPTAHVAGASVAGQRDIWLSIGPWPDEHGPTGWETAKGLSHW